MRENEGIRKKKKRGNWKIRKYKAMNKIKEAEREIKKERKKNEEPKNK